MPRGSSKRLNVVKRSDVRWRWLARFTKLPSGQQACRRNDPCPRSIRPSPGLGLRQGVLLCVACAITAGGAYWSAFGWRALCAIGTMLGLGITAIQLRRVQEHRGEGAGSH